MTLESVRSTTPSLIITVITSVVNIVTTLVAIVFIDRAGRKPLLLIGSAGVAITLGVLAVVLANAPLNAQHQPRLDGTQGLIALWAANLFVFAFGMSWGPVVWVLLGENFQTRYGLQRYRWPLARNEWLIGDLHLVPDPTTSRTGTGLRAVDRLCDFVVLFCLAVRERSKGRELEEMTN